MLILSNNNEKYKELMALYQSKYDTELFGCFGIYGSYNANNNICKCCRFREDCKDVISKYQFKKLKRKKTKNMLILAI